MPKNNVVNKSWMNTASEDELRDVCTEMEEKKADNGIEDEADEPVYVQKMKEMGFDISGF